MIQAVGTRPLSSLSAVPATAHFQRVSSPTEALPYAQDLLKTTSRTINEETAKAALVHLQQQYGALKKSGFFSSPTIDLNEALERLKNGKSVFVNNKSNGAEVRDSFDSFEELMLLDDLQGRKQDHGVAKPELRLPLLFLSKQRLEAYNSNETPERLDPYTAYHQLKRDWRIVINGKDVKPKDLIAHVVASGFTVEQDPGLAVRAQFARLPQNGWKLNGQAVTRDLAYLAWISGDTRLSLDGAEVSSPADFALLLNVVANEPNQAIDTDLRQRLMGLKLNGFHSPVGNYYSVFKHLSTGRALNYGGNVIRNLDEMVIYDALAGSLRPSSLLPGALQEAIRYLGDGGLSVDNGYQAWQKLKAGEAISYTFNGGPTHEPIRLHANSLEQLVARKAEVVAQRQRDQFRPDLSESKQILQERLPQLQDSLKQNLERTRQAMERAEADIPVQEARREEAQRDYNRIKPIYDRTLSDFQQAERDYQSADRRYQSDRRSYEWARDQYQRTERDYYAAQRYAEQALTQARQLDDRARQEEALVNSDPQNAESHRQKAAQYRQQAQSSRGQAERYQQEMNRLRFDLDRQRWDVQRTERDMERSRQLAWDARSVMDSRKGVWQQEQSRLEEASNRLRQAENQLRMARQTLAQGQEIVRLTQDAQQQFNRLSQATERLKSEADYARERQGMQGATQALQQLLNDATYTAVHGNGLANRLQPIATLLINMDKPSQR